MSESNIDMYDSYMSKSKDKSLSLKKESFRFPSWKINSKNLVRIKIKYSWTTLVKKLKNKIFDFFVKNFIFYVKLNNSLGSSDVFRKLWGGIFVEGLLSFNFT